MRPQMRVNRRVLKGTDVPWLERQGSGILQVVMVLAVPTIIEGLTAPQLNVTPLGVEVPQAAASAQGSSNAHVSHLSLSLVSLWAGYYCPERCGWLDLLHLPLVFEG